MVIVTMYQNLKYIEEIHEYPSASSAAYKHIVKCANVHLALKLLCSFELSS